MTSINLLTAVLLLITAPSDAAETTTVAGDVRLILPPIIYTTPELESNIYFRNVVLVLNPDNYAFDVTCEKGKQYQERWTLTPEPDDTGDYPITVAVLDEENRIIARRSSIVRVAPTGSESGDPEPVTMLLIGASQTQASVYPQHLLDLASEDATVSLKLIGSRGAKNKPADGDLRHEGYNGWTTQAFATSHGPLSRTGEYRRPDTGSPFVYEDEAGNRELDFKRYYDQFNDGHAPDFVVLQLGANDAFRETDDTIEGKIDRSLSHYDRLIEKISDAGPNTRIGVILMGPATPSQDGFRNYTGSRKQTAWQYKRNHHHLTERLVEHYGHRTGENIYLIPVNVNLDTENGYPMWTAPRNTRSSEKITRVNNGTHPSDEGYHQIGDTIYGWLKSMLASSEVRRGTGEDE